MRTVEFCIKIGSARMVRNQSLRQNQRKALRLSPWTSTIICKPLFFCPLAKFSTERAVCDAEGVWRALKSVAHGVAPAAAAEKVLLEQLTEYTWSTCFHPRFMQQLTVEGFLCISCELTGNAHSPLFILIPKLHHQRCLVHLHAKALHIPKKVGMSAVNGLVLGLYFNSFMFQN